MYLLKFSYHLATVKSRTFTMEKQYHDHPGKIRGNGVKSSSNSVCRVSGQTVLLWGWKDKQGLFVDQF